MRVTPLVLVLVLVLVPVAGASACELRVEVPCLHPCGSQQVAMETATTNRLN